MPSNQPHPAKFSIFHRQTSSTSTPSSPSQNQPQKTKFHSPFSSKSSSKADVFADPIGSNHGSSPASVASSSRSSTTSNAGTVVTAGTSGGQRSRQASSGPSAVVTGSYGHDRANHISSNALKAGERALANLKNPRKPPGQNGVFDTSRFDESVESIELKNGLLFGGQWSAGDSGKFGPIGKMDVLLRDGYFHRYTPQLFYGVGLASTITTIHLLLYDFILGFRVALFSWTSVTQKRFFTCFVDMSFAGLWMLISFDAANWCTQCIKDLDQLRKLNIEPFDCGTFIAATAFAFLIGTFFLVSSLQDLILIGPIIREMITGWDGLEYDDNPGGYGQDPIRAAGKTLKKSGSVRSTVHVGVLTGARSNITGGRSVMTTVARAGGIAGELV
ncbi:hypothetical protein HDU76_001548 [Blyttiomyces sp. JEL0837]|nr:hypothetical protein HDU76_001548 [Blyttiomyces sp. JEL0837]